jgi:thiol-disulfide isomerase/thioredoxin
MILAAAPGCQSGPAYEPGVTTLHHSPQLDAYGIGGPGVEILHGPCLGEGHMPDDAPVMLVFWREQCPACKRVLPIVDRFVHDYCGQVTMVKIDVDHADVAYPMQYDVNLLPTVVILDDGQVRHRWEHDRAEKVYRKALDQVLANRGKAGR